MKRNLTLATEPVAAAELEARRRANAVFDAAEKSGRDKLMEELLASNARIEATMAMLVAKWAPASETADGLIDAKFIMSDLKISKASAYEIIRKIGVVRVGANGGALRCYRADYNRYRADPENFERQPRLKAA